MVTYKHKQPYTRIQTTLSVLAVQPIIVFKTYMWRITRKRKKSGHHCQAAASSQTAGAFRGRVCRDSTYTRSALQDTWGRYTASVFGIQRSGGKWGRTDSSHEVTDGIRLHRWRLENQRGYTGDPTWWFPEVWGSCGFVLVLLSCGRFLLLPFLRKTRGPGRRPRQSTKSSSW